MTEQIEQTPTRADDDRLSALGGKSLRQHAAHGVLVNSAFQVGLAGVGMLKRVGVAAFLTTSEYGLWGLLITTMVTLAWLKQVGISEKYIQQEESDQEHAFQKAFTLEVLFSGTFFLLLLAALPGYALLYGRSEILVPGLVLAIALPVSALQTPIWVFYRRMQFVRQRSLEAIDPVSAAVVTLGMAAAGFGYWSLVIGTVVGAVLGAAGAMLTSPYRFRWRYDGGTMKEYFSFSWPLFLASLSGLITVQGAVIVGNYTVGLAGLGAIALANAFAVFVDRADQIIRRTIYPVACAVVDRTELLFEAFTKSNRMALMWGLPFGVALALFASDLVDFVLGERWAEAEFLLGSFGLILALRQVAFNWTVFMQAVGRTRPIAANAVAHLLVFMVATMPAMFLWGLDGFIVGMSVAVVVDIGMRTYFLVQIFPGFRLIRHMARAFVPIIPPVLLILGARAVSPAPETLGVAIAELALYIAATILSTWIFERQLINEMFGYLRRRRAATAATTAA